MSDCGAQRNLEMCRKVIKCIISPVLSSTAIYAKASVLTFILTFNDWLGGTFFFFFLSLSSSPFTSPSFPIVLEHVPIYPDRTKSDMARFTHQERQGLESIPEGINCHQLSTACQVISLSVIPHLSLTLFLPFFIPHCMMSFGCFPSGFLNHTLENLFFSFVSLNHTWIFFIHSICLHLSWSGLWRILSRPPLTLFAFKA